MPRYIKFSAIFLCFISLGFTAARASEPKAGIVPTSSSNPVAFVTGVGIQAVTLMGRREGMDNETWKKLHKLVSDTADVKQFSQNALGRYWQKASTDQRQAFQALFVDYLLSRLSGLLGAAGVSGFDVVAWESKKSGETAVVSRMATRAAGDIDVVWLVRDTWQGYRIADLTLAGISVIELSRGEISAVAARQGVAGLIRSMKRRLAARDTLR